MQARLDPPAAVLRRLDAHLAEGERARARRRQASVEHSRFVARHGWLRVALARELGCAPGDVELVAPPGRKPYVAGSQLRFSVTRSGDIALFALCWSAEVGVDVERARLGPDPLRFAARWYTRSERAEVEAAAPSEQDRRCLEIWTRKEAYLKAVGTGLRVPLAVVEVAGACGAGGAVRVGGFVVHQLALGEGLIGAVAVEDRDPPIDVPPVAVPLPAGTSSPAPALRSVTWPTPGTQPGSGVPGRQLR